MKGFFETFFIFFIYFFYILWQLPQFMVGLFVWIFCKLTGRLTGSDFGTACYWTSRSGLSLTSFFVFVNEMCSDKTFMHERGHVKQSIYLGWLYLPVIGVPSIIWAGLRRLGLFAGRSYYSFYTESWADRLGGVKR
ncbi:hypothetical protein N184_36050 [Sinorhizobium sp. GL28]|nr:hypothetical protein N184_36050 [Sinorhizobium sp. GL28]